MSIVTSVVEADLRIMIGTRASMVAWGFWERKLFCFETGQLILVKLMDLFNSFISNIQFMTIPWEGIFKLNHSTVASEF